MGPESRESAANARRRAGNPPRAPALPAALFPATGYRAALRILHLYRPRLPETRAQALQVVHTCHALAARGHEVTLLADRAVDFAGGARDALAAYGLDCPKGLDLRVAPTTWLPGAGLWFRAAVRAWCGRVRQATGESAAPATGRAFVYARAKRYVRLIPAEVPVVLEAHELDSALDVEAGRDPAENRALEAAVLSRAVAVATNCAGTLDCIRREYGTAPGMARTRVIWNATRADRMLRGVGGAGLGVVGSDREYKGVAPATAAAGVPVTLVGGKGNAVPYSAVPAALARFDALLLPLADNLFGRSLTNPLKLWDYLATDRPLVLPDLPSIREVVDLTAPGLYPYDPAHLETLAPAARRALAHGPRTPRLRTWDERASEIESFLAGLP